MTLLARLTKCKTKYNIIISVLKKIQLTFLKSYKKCQTLSPVNMWLRKTHDLVQAKAIRQFCYILNGDISINSCPGEFVWLLKITQAGYKIKVYTWYAPSWTSAAFFSNNAHISFTWKLITLHRIHICYKMIKLPIICISVVYRTFPPALEILPWSLLPTPNMFCEASPEVVSTLICDLLGYICCRTVEWQHYVYNVRA